VRLSVLGAHDGEVARPVKKSGGVLKSGETMNPRVIAVHQSRVHHFSKERVHAITLLEGLGVQGDAHCGVTVQHRSRVAKDPSQPNLRQVHLLQSELFEALATQGHHVRPGDLGENITTEGIDLLELSTGTVLQLGSEARLRITGLRNPCAQIERFQPGLLAAVLDHTADGELVRKAGVMAVVLRGGVVSAQDRIQVLRAAGPHVPLRPV
jgi:MOSC domain-containing protein YiiM